MSLFHFYVCSFFSIYAKNEESKKTFINDKICTRKTVLPWQHGYLAKDGIRKGERLECGCVKGHQVKVNEGTFENRGTKVIKLNVMRNKNKILG